MPRQPRILIVDDEKLARWSVHQTLDERGDLCISEAASGEAALESAATTAFDLIFLDIGLPGISGLDTLQQLREQGCTAAIVIVTAHDEPTIINRALALGARDYLCKPYDLDSITSIVERLLPSAVAECDATPPDAGWARYIGKSPAIVELRHQMQHLSHTHAKTLLIQGPSGGGKSFLADAIHRGGCRAAQPFMEINCAALPAALLESELFGHERGAFTDAKQAKPGLFELADGGTLLLDEIGDMDIALQAKILRVIEERRFKRVGGVKDITVDVCIIATTNVDLAAAVEQGHFRLDLFYRLNVVPLTVPPLSDRPEDIPLLVEGLIERLNEDLGTHVRGISNGALNMLQRYPWPGNIRELRNVLERIFLLNTESTIVVDHLPPDLVRAVLQPAKPRTASAPATEGLAPAVASLLQQDATLDDIEGEVIRQAMAGADGSLSLAGKRLGLHRDTLRYRARKHGIIT